MAFDPLLSLPNGEQTFPLTFTPDFQIVQVNTNGLVVRCSRSFEWGATLQLGVMLHIQVPSPVGEKNLSTDVTDDLSTDVTDELVGDSMLDFKGIVVDCHEVLSYPAAKPQYEITLFYDSITEDQCAALLRASNHRNDLEPDFDQFSLQYPEGFDRVCGLN